MTEVFSRPPGANREGRDKPGANPSARQAHLERDASSLIQDRLFEQFAIIGKAVASKQRLKLLELLAQTERTVEALAREANLSTASVSQHLQVLRAAGLVEATKSGLYVFCRLAGPDVLALIRTVRSVAEKRLGELDRLARSYLMDSNELEPLTSAELLRRLRAGDVVVIDVRPAEEYAAGHLPGAISIPLSQLQQRLKELPRAREVVAYCRGPYCLLAHRAVAMLRRRGKTARRLREGFPEWQAAGMPVEAAPVNPAPEINGRKRANSPPRARN